MYIYINIYVAMSTLLSYPEPHPSLGKNRVQGGSLSLSKKNGFGAIIVLFLIRKHQVVYTLLSRWGPCVSYCKGTI